MSSAALIGSHYGDRNIGDVAIAAVVRHALKREGYGSIRLLVLRGDQAGCESDVLDLRRANAWRQLLSGGIRPRMVVVGGGGILQNSTSTANLVVHFVAAAAGRLLGARVVLAGIGVGPLKGAFARWLAGWTVRLARDGCLVRDPLSQSFCQRWSVSPVACAPDLAFALPLVIDGNSLAGGGGEAGGDGKGRILLSLRPPVGGRSTRLKADERYLAGLKQVVATAVGFAEATGRQVAFLAMHPEQDMLVWAQLCARQAGMESIPCVVPEDPVKLLHSIRSDDLVVGMRLHAIIFAAMAGAQFVALGYDPKVAALATALGCEEGLVDIAGGWCDGGNLERALWSVQHAPRDTHALVREFGGKAWSAVEGVLGAH